MTPVLCLVTDGRWRSGDGELVQRIAAAARAGVHLIQVRERDLDGGPLLDLVRQCVEAVRHTRARVIVNERLDVALAAGAHGVHLRGDSMPAARVRPIVPAGFLIGRSIHSVEEAQAASRVDYLVFGTVFETASKAGRTPAGVTALASAVAVTSVPVLAVGGVTVQNARAVAATGAAGVAAIGLFASQPAESLQLTVSRLHMAFDEARGLS